MSSKRTKSNVMIEEPPRAGRDENSLPHFGASIDGPPAWAQQVAGACLAAVACEPSAALAVVLRHLREAAGAERAFLLEAAPAGRARIVASSAARRDDDGACSTSVAARALCGDRPLFFADVRRESLWADGTSVRALALRSALAAPLPTSGGRRAAVVLDSREPLQLTASAGCDLVRAFAGLLALLRRAAPPDPPRATTEPAGAVGGSAAFLKLEDEVRVAASVPLPALVVGETGSGKELVARALHEGGGRARRPFVAINCAAIPEALLERELFGATRGAFTGADRDHPGLFRKADGGTVFLDEIGDMPLSLQAKLLRVLQEGAVRAVGALDERAVDVRVVAATHRDLELLVAENRFRADLRWRLEVLVLRVPPLRERVADLPVLAARLIDRIAARCGRSVSTVAPCAIERLAAHPWPGNVRELESALARAFLRATDGAIRAEHVDVGGSSARAASDAGSMERSMVEEALRASRGNLTAAAARIGWSRQALYRKIHALGVMDAPRSLEQTERQEASEPGGTRSSLNSTFQ